MRIDRTRFLALTAALAACNSAPPPTTPGGTLEIPATVTQVDPPDASAPAPTSSGPVFARHDAGAPIAEGEPTDACTATNAQGTPADCTQIKRPSAPQCESFDDTVEECTDASRFLKPAVAEKATKCILAKSGTRALCQFGVAQQCVSQAFRSSCVDPANAKECREISQRCASAGSRTSATVTTSECQGALSAVAAKHRPALLSCMNEGCNAGSCISYLR
jgi:hypothetical protein